MPLSLIYGDKGIFYFPHRGNAMENSPISHPRKRVVYLDFLRIPAALCIILLHVSAQNWDNVSVYSNAWLLFNAANSASRWAVPVFLMISGALLLNPDTPSDTARLWRGPVCRMLRVFFIWSTVYSLDALSRGAGLESAVSTLIQGKYHMWYLPTLAGLYMVTPLIRRITESRQLTRYFLMLTGAFAVLIPSAIGYLRCVDIPVLSRYLPAMDEFFSRFHYGFGGIYLFYFVLGHYLARYGFPVVSPSGSGLMAAGGYAATVVLNLFWSRKTGGPDTVFLTLDSANVLCMSMGIFLLARNCLNRLPPWAERLVSALSPCTFGIYLIHPLVLERLEMLGVHTLAISPVLSVPGITILTGILSGLLTALLIRIPFAKKYLL